MSPWSKNSNLFRGKKTLKPEESQPLPSLANLHKTDRRRVDFIKVFGNVLSTLSIFSVGGKSSKLFQMLSIGFVDQNFLQK